MPAPPWAALRTASPERFSFRGRNNELVMFAGNENLLICRLNLRGKRLRLEVPRRGGIDVLPYRLSLPRWTSVEPPLVRMHPFALLHLLATGQVDTNELLQHATQMGQDTVRFTIAITQPCDLLRILALPRAAVVFSTSYGLSMARD